MPCIRVSVCLQTIKDSRFVLGQGLSSPVMNHACILTSPCMPLDRATRSGGMRCPNQSPHPLFPQRMTPQPTSQCSCTPTPTHGGCLLFPAKPIMPCMAVQGCSCSSDAFVTLTWNFASLLTQQCMGTLLQVPLLRAGQVCAGREGHPL